MLQFNKCLVHANISLLSTCRLQDNVALVIGQTGFDLHFSILLNRNFCELSSLQSVTCVDHFICSTQQLVVRRGHTNVTELFTIGYISLRTGVMFTTLHCSFDEDRCKSGEATGHMRGQL